MKRYLIAVCFLAGCAAPQSISGPAVQAALALPNVQFNGANVLAREVAATCPTYTVSDEITRALLQRRAAPELPTLAGIDVEVDVAKRSFQAKHGLTVGRDTTCDAIAAEIATGTALSVFFEAT